ncbi:MAG TPA: dihydrofolate reductase family protein [Thermomicrobiales bacterium]|jgi:riboflavin biosynthesis pyrimidine reductase
MTVPVVGPGTPFVSLLEEDADPGLRLPAAFQRIYGGDWPLPAPGAERPYTYMNFVVSRDGRVSFAEPGHLGGGDVSGFNAHDQWLMGLLRSRCDAVLNGDNTLRLEPSLLLTPDHIFPADAAAFAALRAAEGRRAVPLHVFLSLEGDLPVEAAVFGRPEVPILIATTTRGVATTRAALGDRAQVTVRDFGTDSVDPVALLATLRREYGVRSLLCEGGPRTYGTLLGAGLVDDEFLTLSPLVIGNHPPGIARPRPSLVEGIAFAPGRTPTQRLLAIRRAGDHLFLRSRYRRD